MGGVGEASGEEETVGEGVVDFGDATGLCVGVGVGFAVGIGVGSSSEDGVGEGLGDGFN